MKITISDRSPVLHDGKRYEAGESYNVDTETGGLFKGQGWATSAEKDADLSEPLVLREATEEDAERHRAEAQERLERFAREQRGEQEPDLDVQDGLLGSSSEFE